MKILVVTHFFASHGGGIEISTQRLLEKLQARHAHQFTWAASDCDAAKTSPHFTVESMRSFNICEKLTGLPWPIWSPGALIRLRKLVATHDLVWLQDGFYMGNVAAAFFARRMKKPVVITQHVGGPPARNLFVRALTRLALFMLAHPMHRKADQVAFVSDRVRDEFTRRLRYRKEPLLIANGVDHTKFFPADAARKLDLRRKYKFADHARIMLFVGRFVERKGLAMLHDLAKRLPELQWVLIGQGQIDPDEWDLPNLRAVPQADQNILCQYYQLADLMVMPSLGEGFPLVIQEAMACGLPVLCSEETAEGCVSAKPVLHTCYIDPDRSGTSAARWDGKIRTILRNESALATRSREVHQFAMDFWNWDKAAETYDKLFRALVAR